MKKIFLLLILAYPVILYSQPAGGDGSSGSPYSGVITTPWTLSGDKYCGNLSVTSGTFTIDPGSTLRFGVGNSLAISGTAALFSVGNSSNYITFTSSGVSWGHISFDNPSSTASSVINFCIIEKGSVTGSGYLGAGGGILIRHSYVTVSNSIIRNNSSDWGGGIFIDANKNPYINNSLFKENTTIHGGGGIYCWNGVSSVIENCIFDNNHCSEPSVSYYTGGGLTAQTGCAIYVLNCTFINNTSTRTEGQGLMLHASGNSRVINSIFWGVSDKQIYSFNTSASVIINSAYRGITYTSGTPISSVLLNATNDAITGPNFNATDGSDWSIKFISPCRDAGTIPSPAVPTDYTGKSRVGVYDIGAFEVQYSRWLTNASTPTSWTTAGNWEQGLYPGLAGTTGDVIIPSMINDSYAPNITGTTTISPGKYLILEPGAKATFGTITNSGILKLKSNSSTVFSLKVNSYSGNDASLDLFLTGGGTKTPLTYKWHYISSPVTSLPVSTFAPTYTQNVAQWIEDRPATSLTQGWVAYDGYIYSTGGMGGPTFATLTPGKGYNYFDATDNTFTFGGQINTGDVNAALSYKIGDDDLYGLNLIGNPFTSGLDWDYITANSFPLNTTKTLYFTRNSVLCTYSNGVGVPGDVNGIIPPMQGFFSKTYSAGNTIVLAAAARTHNNIHATYKGSKALIPLVRLALADSLLTDETVVRFDDLAKSYLDNDFDAVKMFLDPSLSSIHTSLGGTDYAINGLPYPDPLLEIPVTLNIATDEETKSITASELQNLDNYNVTLTDLSTGFVADLRTTPTVTFAAPKGTLAGRFILKISTITTGVETPVLTNNKFNIYPANNNINIQTIADEWEGKSGTVRVMDLTGKTISDLKNTEFRKNSLTQVASPGVSGIYMVEIRAGNMRYVGKVVIR